MGLMALAAISSIGGAFAFSPKAHRTLNTYYANKVGSDIIWETAPPAHKSCSNTSLNFSCTVQAASKPADNTMPAGQPVTNQVYQ